MAEHTVLLVTYVCGQLTAGANPIWMSLKQMTWTTDRYPPRLSDLEQLRRELLQKELCPDCRIVNWQPVTKG